MFDAAQFLRNQSIQANRFDALAAMQATETKAAQAAPSGSVMGTSFVVESDPAAELLDSMEELSFQFEEKAAKKAGERKLGEMRGARNPIVEALENWAKTLPDMVGKEFLEGLVRMLRQMQRQGSLPDAKGLLQMLGEGSGDPSCQFAALDVLEQMLADADAELADLVRTARETLVNEKGGDIRAGINLAQEVNARATTPEEMQGLRDLYRAEVLGFTSPQACFRSIVGTRGAAGLQAAIDFLTAGCGVDLQSAHPSKSTEELSRILGDLQCVQVLKTALDKMTGLETRMLRQFGIACALNGEAMTGRVLDFTERPGVTPDAIGGFVSACGVEAILAQLDFCRELVALFRQLSPRLFEKESDRRRLVEAGEEHLDGLVALEADEQEEDDEEEARAS